MALQIAGLSLQLIEVLRPLVGRVRRRDRSLADQLVRAASSVALNIAEGDASYGGNQRVRFFTAAGSASESLAALRVAVAWGYLEPQDAAASTSLLKRILAGLWKLSQR